MSTKKRSRQEYEEQDNNNDNSENDWQVEIIDTTKQGLVRGLCHLWGNDSKPLRFDLYRELGVLEGINTKRNKERKLPLNQAAKKDKPHFQKHYYKHMPTLWDVITTEAQQDLEQTRHTITFQQAEIHQQGSRHVSTLQKRLLENGPTAILTPQLKKYLNALTVFEYEHDHGTLSGQADDMQLTLVGSDSIWTPIEKNKFFIALERCGKNIKEISRRVGPTKTLAEVYDYFNLLQKVSEGIGKDNNKKPLTAREMSPLYILQENRLAIQLQHALETESYAKHLEVVQDTSKTDIQVSNQLLELWNMSSLTRFFSGTQDMTILTSATFNFTQLIKHFISDIIKDLHTHLLNIDDKTVTVAMMNLVISKRQRHNKDQRLKDMDIMALLDRRFKFHQRFSAHRSASFLAKRRRIAYEHDPDLEQEEEEELIIEEEDDEQEEEEEEEEEEEKEEEEKYPWDDDDEEDVIRWQGEEETDDEELKDEDEFLDPVNTQDEVQGRFITIDSDAEFQDTLEEYLSSDVGKKESMETIDTFNNDEEERMIKELEADEKEEVEMERLDRLHEMEMSNYLGLYNEEQVFKAYLKTADKQTRRNHTVVKEMVKDT